MDIFGYDLPVILGYQVPKTAIVIVLLVLFWFAATFGMRVMMSGAARLFGMAGQAAQPEAAAMPAADIIAFARADVDGADWPAVEALNADLAQLQARRKATLPRQGALLASDTAWWSALFEQAALHRILALAGGTIALWRAGNPVAAALSARSLLESGAIILDAAQALHRLAAQGDTAGIAAYLLDRTFVTTPGHWIDRARRTRPADLPRLLDEADRLSPGVRFRYDRLSEIAAPEALGQHAVFGAIDRTGTSATFALDASRDPATFSLLAGAMQIITPVSATLKTIEVINE
jgi:hypothetical protein